MHSYIIKLCPTNNSILCEGSTHEFYNYPEVFYENTFLENFTNIWDEVFLSDNSRLLTCNCCIRDSVAGVFLWICEAVWSSYPVLYMAFKCTVYRYSKKIYRKTPMSQFLFNEVAGRHLQALLKEVCLLERQTEVLMNIFLYLFCHNKNCDLWWLNLCNKK